MPCDRDEMTSTNATEMRRKLRKRKNDNNAGDTKEDRIRKQRINFFHQLQLSCDTRINGDSPKMDGEATIKHIGKTPEENSNFNDVISKHLILNLLESEFTCCICEEIIAEASVTRCGHMLCAYCLKQSKKRCSTCPLCRAQRISEHPAKSVDEFIDKLLKLLSDDLYAQRKNLIDERKVAAAVTAKTAKTPKPCQRRSTRRSMRSG